VNISPWSGLVGPAKMAPDLVDKIQRGFVEVMKKPAIVEQMTKLGQAVTVSSPQEMTVFLREQLGIFKKAIADQGIQQE
jgi:tripartite-type tricarboxylate transporter receptor subunit TctC